MRKINTINDRIIQIIDEDCGGNRSEFARRLEITPTYAAQLYKGERIPGDRIVSSICREFNIRREWLETGKGDMKIPEIETDFEIINELLADTASPTADLIRNIWNTYRQLPPDHQKILDNFIATLLNQK